MIQRKQAGLRRPCRGLETSRRSVSVRGMMEPLLLLLEPRPALLHHTHTLRERDTHTLRHTETH